MSTDSTHRPGAPFYVHIVLSPSGDLAPLITTNRAAAAEIVRGIRSCEVPYRGTLLVDPRDGAVWDDSLHEAQH